MTKPRLSMKLLYKLYLSYPDQGVNGNDTIVNFLDYVGDEIKQGAPTKDVSSKSPPTT